MRKYYQKGKRFFVCLISMLLIINQLTILTPAADLKSELETWASGNSSEEISGQNQQAKTEADVSEDEITEIENTAEEETVMESTGRTHQKNESEVSEANAGLLDNESAEKADSEELLLAEDEDDEVQTERGPPAESTLKAAADAEEKSADKDLTVLTFTSDIHNSSNNTAANRLDTWLDRVAEMYGGVDVMSFCGDMGAAQAGESDFWTYTRSVLGVAEGKDIPNVYTTGNHEIYNGKFSTTSNSMKDGYIVDAEGMEGENFRIYCLGTDNWNNNQDNYTTEQISKLGNYLDSVGADKPIIILTHYPLHYFPSSSSWGGGGRQTTNADLVIDTLNDAADAGKTIVLLWGHNHTVSDTHYDEMYTPGTTIEYKNGSTKVFNFYYGAAGCMSDSEYGTGSAFVKGKGLVITIDSDKNLTFNYYDANGNDVTESSSGGDDPSPGGDDETGEGVTPEDGKKYVILASDGYALTSEGDEVGYTNGSEGSEQYNYYGLSGEEYTVGEDVAPDRLLWTFTAQGDGFLIQSQDGKYLNGTYTSNSTGGYDGTLKLDDTPDVWIINGASSGSTVSAHILKSTNASQSDAGDKYLTHGNGDSSVSNIFTLRSESNATSTVFYEYTDDGTFIEPDPDNPVTPTGEIRYEETDHFEAGKEYIVAVTKDDSSVYAISKGSSSVSAATLDVTAASGETPAYIKTNTSSVLWEYSSSGYLKNGSDYLYPTSSNGVITYTSGRAVNYTDGKLSYETSSSGTYYITCSSGSFGTSSSEEDAAIFRLFVKTQETTPDDPTPGEGIDYVLTDTLEAGKNYVIASSSAAGNTYILGHDGSTAETYSASIAEKDGYLTITTDREDAAFEAAEITNGFSLTNGGYYVTVEGSGTLTFSTDSSTKYWNYVDNKLSNASSSATRYLTFSDGEFKGYYTSSNPSPSDIFLFVEKEEGDPVAVTDVALDKEEISVEAGKTEQLKATVSPSNASNKAVSWTSSDETVATVDQNGLVTAVKEGTATITVTTEDGGKTAVCEVTVTAPAAEEGTIYKLTDQFTDGKEYLIVSSDAEGSAYALTNPGGSSGGTSMGQTEVAVKSGDVDEDGTADIYIRSDAEDIVWTAAANGDGFDITNGTDYLEGKSGNVRIYNSQQYSDRYWTYEGSQFKHVGGSNTYTVYYSSGFTSTYNESTNKIYIYEKYADEGDPVAVTDVALDKETISVEAGKTDQLKATVSPANASNKAVSWTSSDETVATVDQNGLVTAVKEGTATITVTTEDGGKTAVCEVTVTAPAAEEGTIYKLTDQFTDGKEYLIVSSDAEGSAYALTNPGGSSGGTSMGQTEVAVKSGDVDEDGTADIYIRSDAEDIVWTAAANGDGFDITNGTDYLEGKSGNVRIYNSQQYSDRYWTYEGSQFKHVGGSNTYTVYYSSGFTSTYNESTNKIYIYQKYEEGEHDHVWDDGVVTKEATCEEAGVKTYTCSICGETKTEEIPATGHDWGALAYEWSADNSTVTAIRTCANDAAHVETETVGTTSEVTKDATCEEKGETTYTAVFTNTAFAKQTKTEENIDALGHSLTKTEAVAATCEEAGNSEYYTCTVCGKYFSDAEGKTEIEKDSWILQAIGHKWDEGKVTKEATYTEEGVKTYTCKNDASHTKTESIPVLEKTGWIRLAGKARYDTMEEIVKEGFQKTGGTVVVATGSSFKDALAAAGLAGLYDAPVILTDGKTLSSQARKQLIRLKPSKVFVAGGEAAVSKDVYYSIWDAAGVKPDRRFGQTSAGTSAALAKAGLGWSDTAIIATNKSFKDALSAAPLAYSLHMPILLADNGKSLNKEVLDALKSCNIRKVIIVGGTLAVTGDVENQLIKNGISNISRIGGSTAVDTSANIAEYAISERGMTINGMGVATSQNYPDALAGAALCGHNNSVLVLADDKAMKNTSFPKKYKADFVRGYVFGGTSAVSDKVFKALEAAVK